MLDFYQTQGGLLPLQQIESVLVTELSLIVDQDLEQDVSLVTRLQKTLWYLLLSSKPHTSSGTKVVLSINNSYMCNAHDNSLKACNTLHQTHSTTLSWHHCHALCQTALDNPVIASLPCIGQTPLDNPVMAYNAVHCANPS